MKSAVAFVFVAVLWLAACDTRVRLVPRSANNNNGTVAQKFTKSQFISCIKYVEDNSQTGLKFTNRQSTGLNRFLSALRQSGGYYYIDVASAEKRKQLKSEWERKKNMIKKQFTQNYNEETGESWEWKSGLSGHHVFPRYYGGPNEWWNLFPVVDPGTGHDGPCAEVFPEPIIEP